MTWFRKDDQWPHHPKVRRAGRDGRALWDAAGPLCAGRNSDGVVEAIVIKDACYLAEVDNETAAVKALISSGLWHDEKTLKKCERCKRVAGKLPHGGCYFHDWLEYQLTKDVAKLPEERLRWRRGKALSRNVELREAIVQRDRSLCRYCGERVDFRDRVGPLGGTYDHVDPDGDNSLDNCVVACRRCNGVKCDRTPAEAGMPLYPPGTTRADILAGAKPLPGPDQAGARSGPDRSQPDAGSDQAPRARRTRGGTGQAGAKPEPGLGQVGDGDGPERGGTAPGQDGPGTETTRPDDDRGDL